MSKMKDLALEADRLGIDPTRPDAVEATLIELGREALRDARTRHERGAHTLRAVLTEMQGEANRDGDLANGLVGLIHDTGPPMIGHIERVGADVVTVRRVERDVRGGLKTHEVPTHVALASVVAVEYA